MRKLVVVRHGHGGYAVDSALTTTGKDASRKLGEKIKALTNGGSFAIATSTSTRSYETGCIIAEVVGCEGKPHKNEAIQFPAGAPILYTFIDQLGAQADIVVLVSHAGSAENIADRYAMRMGAPCCLSKNPLDYCSGFVVDLESRVVESISYE